MTKNRILNIIRILILIFTLFYTKTIYGLSNTYQDMLFTTKDKIDKNNDKFSGYTFKYGGNIKDIQPWNRYKIGYPYSAITIDNQVKNKITQGRIQIEYIIINLVFGGFIILLFNIVIKIFTRIKGVIDNSKIFK
ncbi:hypothetical protein [Soonwooa sp.]|uniref:hypothetical protein n=1 Tax=Soonwooa sp. TaxID=1938592 RepID=UPI0026361C07|nr:hypothetical protein [Soonwooa sp.]